jgi:hypothetical protein
LPVLAAERHKQPVKRANVCWVHKAVSANRRGFRPDCLHLQSINSGPGTRGLCRETQFGCPCGKFARRFRSVDSTVKRSMQRTSSLCAGRLLEDARKKSDLPCSRSTAAPAAAPQPLTANRLHS